MNRPANNSPEPARVRTSIARALSSQLFVRLLGIFFCLDIMICILSGTALFIYSERKAASAAAYLERTSSLHSARASIPEIQGVSISSAAGREPGGVRVIKPFSYFFPEKTRNSIRNVEFGVSGARFFRKLDSLSYNVFYESGLSAHLYKITVELGTFLLFFQYAFIALIIYEVPVLLFRVAKDRRIVRRALEPISDLAAAARSLNQMGGQFDPEKMAAIANKLESINASRLDTRLQVDGTQDELKNLALSINGMLDRINESYLAQVRFVSDASHELRTPISVIQGYANLLDRWGKNDERTLQESITAIKDEAANMKELVEQLLFLARGDNDTIRLHPEDVNLRELAKELIHETQMIDTAHTFALRAADVSVTADRALLKQALRILVDNSIKYTDTGGNITLATGRENDFVFIAVTDDGIGISPEVVPQIFARFYRADESRARATGGAGLGLSIAGWIAARHGGHMDVLSRVGIGTKISLVLPGKAQVAAPDNSALVDNQY